MVSCNRKRGTANAIEWLNKHTDNDLSFFLVEIHTYKIADSEPAPQFKIVEQPNDFVKSVKSISKHSDISETEKCRLEFWSLFNEVLESRGKPFNKRKATTDHWYNVAIGSSECYISIDLVNKEHKIRVGVWVQNNKDLFDKFYSNKDEIESKCGFKLVWNRLNNRKNSQICTYIHGLDFDKQDNYSELINNSIDLVLTIKSAFIPFLR